MKLTPVAVLVLLEVLSSAAQTTQFVNGEWTYGRVDGFHATSGHFNGSVCVGIMTPAPACGWKIELIFYGQLRFKPVVPQGVFDFQLFTMDWFEYVNRPDNGDLRNAKSACLDVSLQAETDDDQPPDFEARMSCACYNV